MTGKNERLAMRPREMTDGEIKAELKTATGERGEALRAEVAERRAYRAGFRGSSADVVPTIGCRGAGKVLEDL
jgi:hypothetical protein